uniref:Uncharacterized protein n=1 Tax=Phytophthora ramorum TaxID=164328 RepID=H3HD51_PHYRM
MEANVAASPQARDADGNALMSLEELKENMFHSIRDNGTVELIRAQLRRRFIEKLQQQRHSNNERDDGENDASCVNRDVSNSTPDEKLAHGLVAEYLATKGLENTLAVFVPEIGGSRNQMDSATILEEMQRANTGHSLLLVLVQELVRRFQLATMDSGTQTAMDCFDHRIVLDNQLRRVENAYLAECAAQKLEPQKSLEERMVQYQRDKQDRLQERERELELAFVGRRTELETSLFETRQSLFKDMERLRVKEAELQVKVESDFRHFASETQRFQLWEESTKQDELADREQSLTTETGTLKTLKTQVLALQQEGAALEAALSKSGDDLRVAQNLTSRLAESEAAAEKYQSQYEDEKVHVESLRHDVASLNSLLTQAQATINAKHGAPRDIAHRTIKYEEEMSEHS